MKLTYVHPTTKKPLNAEDLKQIYLSLENCYDFSLTNKHLSTKNNYNEFYNKNSVLILTRSKIEKHWSDKTIPWRVTMLKSIGDLNDKKILLLGNGESYKEYYFLLKGAKVVYTDLSIVAVAKAKNIFEKSELFNQFKDKIAFCSVDATAMPFQNNEFDLIYGTKFVGFLNNLDEFFKEVYRCLNNNGLCRFGDDAFAPVWEYVRKQTNKYNWRGKKQNDISIVRKQSTFGIRKDLVLETFNKYKFKEYIYIQEYFFLRVLQLLWGKIFGFSEKRLLYAKPLFLLGKGADKMFSFCKWIQKNSLALTWGFTK